MVLPAHAKVLVLAGTILELARGCTGRPVGGCGWTTPPPVTDARVRARRRGQKRPKRLIDGVAVGHEVAGAVGHGGHVAQVVGVEGVVSRRAVPCRTRWATTWPLALKVTRRVMVGFAPPGTSSS